MGIIDGVEGGERGERQDGEAGIRVVPAGSLGVDRLCVRLDGGGERWPHGGRVRGCLWSACVVYVRCRVLCKCCVCVERVLFKHVDGGPCVEKETEA